MKSIICLALAASLVAATSPVVEDFNKYSVGDWFTTNFNMFVLSILLPLYAFVGYFTALFGSPDWFTNNAFSAVSGTFALPSFNGQRYNGAFAYFKA
jgi:hypothetical protein